MIRTQLLADPHHLFLHDVILDSCRRNKEKIALIDTSCGRRMTYAEYGDTVENLARGLVAAGIRPGEVVAVFLPNCWEFCASYHAITLAGAVPTLLNPSYREREVRYQLENSGATILISNGCNLDGISLAGLPTLRRVYATREASPGAEDFSTLVKPSTCSLSQPPASSEQTIAALPYSSGTTGLPKGVMLSHFNLVANVYQFLGPKATELRSSDTLLCFLPLYHIYGLNVMLNPALVLGATLVLMPRFNVQSLTTLMVEEGITMMPLVPPAMNALCQAAEAGQFPREHNLLWVKSGAAPLAPDLPRRFTALTNIPVVQGYGMTEASPVTHIGFLEPELYRPDSIGHPLAQTDCRVIAESGAITETRAISISEAGTGEPGTGPVTSSPATPKDSSASSTVAKR
jgi:acyl-CoA synthetase (AMP-forming)/AMP-acid ligase II